MFVREMIRMNIMFVMRGIVLRTERILLVCFRQPTEHLGEIETWRVFETIIDMLVVCTEVGTGPIG